MRNSIGVLTATMLLVVTVNAQSTENNGKSFLWKQCNEDVIKLYIDPEPLQQLLPVGYTVLLFEGQAWVLIIAQDCPYYWFDGEEVGAAHDIHMWVAIKGSQDMRPVVGVDHTLPTMTWFNLFAGSDNARVREAWVASGTASVPIESVSLDPPATERGGQVLLDSNQSFSWIVKTNRAPIRLLGVNHDVYERDSVGNIVLNRIQAQLNVSAYDSPGTLEVVGGMGREGFISAGTYDVEVHSFFPIWARASLGEVQESGPVPVEIVSDGATMQGQFFKADCAGPCPTLLLVPGFPGSTQHEVLGLGARLSEGGISVLVFNPRGLHQRRTALSWEPQLKLQSPCGLIYAPLLMHTKMPSIVMIHPRSVLIG